MKDSLIKLAGRAGLDWFLFAMLGLIGLAWLYPSLGVGEGYFSLKSLANYGIALIFFFYGLRLSPEKFKAGLVNWKLHIVVHVSTFVVFPMLVLLAKGTIQGIWGEGDTALWMGIFYLAVLPSTVSSSVVMVSIAHGNMPAAIFNASISSLLGVFITPLWMQFYLSTSAGEGLDLTHVIFGLILQVLLPVALGLFLHHRFGWFSEKYKKSLRIFDQLVILMIIYTSFCDSFAGDMFSGFSWGNLLLLGAGMFGLFASMYAVILVFCRILRFSREDYITALFCGSKKSLVHGTVMSKVLFANLGSMGIILLPTMLYHALQLIVASIIAQTMGRRYENKEN